MPDANRMTRAEAQRYGKRIDMSPTQWEKRVGGLYKMNGWRYWRDLDKPEKSNKRGNKVNATRMPGKPDWEGRQIFDAFPHKALMVATQTFQAGICYWVIIECKTGNAKPTEPQQRYIDDVNATPGMVGIIAYPWHEDYIVEVLGGERGV